MAPAIALRLSIIALAIRRVLWPRLVHRRLGAVRPGHGDHPGQGRGSRPWPNAWRRSAPSRIRTWRSWSSTTGAPTGPPRSPASIRRAPTPGSASSRSTTCPTAGPARPTPCRSAADQARGEWFWFLDADTRHAPENLSIVMEYARRHSAALASLLPEMRCETLLGEGRPAAGGHRADAVVSPAPGQQRPLVAGLRQRPVHPDPPRRPTRRPGATARSATGSSRTSRLAGRVKALGLPIRVAIDPGDRLDADVRLARRSSSGAGAASSTTPWAAAPGGSWAGCSTPWSSARRATSPWSCALVLLARGGAGPFSAWLLGLSLVHHTVLRTRCSAASTGSRSPARGTSRWFPLANLVMDWILLRAIRMCLTGRVTWRGTAYGPPPSAAGDQAGLAGNMIRRLRQRSDEPGASNVCHFNNEISKRCTTTDMELTRGCRTRLPRRVNLNGRCPPPWPP